MRALAPAISLFAVIGVFGVFGVFGDWNGNGSGVSVLATPDAIPEFESACRLEALTLPPREIRPVHMKLTKTRGWRGRTHLLSGRSRNGNKVPREIAARMESGW